MEFQVHSLTPIVTGYSSEGTNRQLLGTGLKGSLRYQYWLMKAMEGWRTLQQQANLIPYRAELDHPDYSRDPHSRENLRMALRNAGPVVQLFGTTGWRPVFDIDLDNCRRGPDPMDCSARFDKKSPYQWDFTLKFRRNRKSTILEQHADGQAPILNPGDEIQGLMEFVHQWGWLGAAPQNGLGWVEISNSPPEFKEPPSNPFFAACDIEVTPKQMGDLCLRLQVYYQNKLERRNGEHSRAIKEKANKKYIGFVKARIDRYEASLAHFATGSGTGDNESEGAVKPIGYEIRRFLKDQSGKFNPFGDKGDASQIHVSHPVFKNGQWVVRIRFCSRPGMLVADEKEPANWLTWCQGVITGEEPKTTPKWPKRRFLGERDEIDDY